jgi:hypothetical protein
MRRWWNGRLKFYPRESGMPVVHSATVLEISDTAAPSALRILCRPKDTVPITTDVHTWRASFQPQRVTCRRCLARRAKT